VLNNGALANPLASPGSNTMFILTVTAPNGCMDMDTVLVTVVPDIIIPSGFTPTGDGANDTWQIDLIDQFPDCTVEVYNRWGELLFSSTGYKDPWDGTYNGSQVPVGTYYYAIELNDERFPEPYTGPLTVIR
jgi:gliding motility-associated-like protein